MLNLNKNNTYKTTPLLRLGFRPFFFGSGVIAVVAMTLWVFLYQSTFTVTNIAPHIWHAHEMIFAYSSAAIVGFLLTASRNWTGIQTIYSKPLLALFVLWAAGRFSFFIDSEYLLYQSLVDTSFLVLSTISISYPIIKAKNWINISILSKILLLTISHIVYYLGVFGIVEGGVNIGLLLGFYLVISIIFMMSRRLIPFFIERGLEMTKELKNSKLLDISSLALFLIFILFEVFYQNAISNFIAGVLFVIHTIRMRNWYQKNIWKKSLLWSIYLSYGLLNLGFALKAISYFIELLPNIYVHSFAFGIALMTLSLMSRVSLGHTGRDVFDPPKRLNLMFLLLVLSFVFRVLVVSINIEHYSLWIFISQTLWIASFSYFVFIYSPMFFKARVDGQFG